MMPNKHMVLVTRPAKQAEMFVGLLNDNGLGALAFPCIEIQPVGLSKGLSVIFETIQHFDLIIFISANAVEYGNKLLRQHSIGPDSITAKIATIGQATLNAANAAGFNVSISPTDGYNSQALLALEECQANHLKGARCLIFRGIGGLEYLADELRQRGAQAQYAEVYQRTKPQADKYISRIELSRHWQRHNINVITATSNESIQNLYDMLELPGKTDMLTTRLIVASQRGVELAQSLGFKKIKCAQSAVNQHMLQAIESE